MASPLFPSTADAGEPAGGPPAEVASAIAVLQLHDGAPDRPFGAAEEAALALLYRHYAAGIARTCAPLLRSPADVEDVVHDVFVRLPTALRRYRAGDFPAWLARVARRAALCRLRRARARREDDLPDGGHGPPGCPAGRTPNGAHVASPAALVTEPDLRALEDGPAVRRALAQLPEALRAVVVLRAEGYAHREIAAALGIAPNACEVRYHRAVRRLRDLLRS